MSRAVPDLSDAADLGLTAAVGGPVSFDTYGLS